MKTVMTTATMTELVLAAVGPVGVGTFDGEREEFTGVAVMLLPVGTLLGVTTEGALLGVALLGVEALAGATEGATEGAGATNGQVLAVKPPRGFWTQVPEGIVPLVQPTEHSASEQTPPVNEPSGLHAPVPNTLGGPRGAQKGSGRYWITAEPLQVGSDELNMLTRT